MPHAPPTRPDSAPTLFMLGTVTAVVLIVWLLPGKPVTGLTPRQQQLEQALNRTLAALGTNTRNLACTSGFKTPIYYSCEVGSLSTTAIGAALEAQGWVPEPPHRSEFLRYKAPSLIATLGADSVSHKWLLTVYDSRD